MRILIAATIAATMAGGALAADTAKPAKPDTPIKAEQKKGVAFQPVLAKRSLRGSKIAKKGVGVSLEAK